MWQRIQTLYLFIATVAVAALFGCDVARIPVAGSSDQMIAFTEKPLYLIFIIVLTVLQVLSLGGFKWRMRQFRVTIVTGIVCVAFQCLLGWDYFVNRNDMAFSWTILLPAVAALCDFLAARNIMLDEAIVQSAHRLRKPRK